MFCITLLLLLLLVVICSFAQRQCHYYWVSDEKTTIEQEVFAQQQEQWQKTQRPKLASLLWIARKSHYTSYSHGNLEHHPQTHTLPLNLINAADVMTDKVNLATLLYASGNTRLQPETRVIYDESDCYEFLRLQQKQHIWLRKEARLSRGEGVMFYDGNNSRRICSSSSGGEPFILQRHIDEPLLLNGKKSELRAYWLIASLEPFRVFLYDRGTVRLATRDFAPNNWTDPLIHVVNTHQQKLANPFYEETAHERKWSFEALEQELSTTTPDWIDTELIPALSTMIRTVAEAARPTLQSANPVGAHSKRFELFGMDVMFSHGDNCSNNGGIMLSRAQLCMWLTEIQVGPGLSCDCDTKRQLIPQMLRDTVTVIVDESPSSSIGTHWILLI